MELPITFFLALSLSVLLTYKVRSWAVRLGIVDLPDTVRRFHSRPTPRAGGVGIFVSFALVVALAWARGHIDLGGDEMFARQFLALTLGGAMIFGLGLADDASGGLRARTKFAIQATIAVAVFMLGVRIEGFALPGGFFELPTAFSLLLTVFWIVGVTNAFNLIDGSDGVAGGAAVFAAAAMAAVSLLNGNELGAIVAITLAGATIGFLVFNFPPASIFLGDSGSLFLGFTLATLGVITTQTAQTALAVAIPVVSCGLPILDTLLAMARRALRGESLFTPDRGHIHHRLRDLGHSPRRVALILYAASAAFGLLSLLLIQPSGRPVAALFILAGAVVWIAVQRLRIPELVEVGRILGRGARQREAIAHNVRIRDAVERVRGAVTPERIFEALRESFEAGEFDRGEMWLPAGFAAALVGPKTGVVPDGEGCRWSWKREVTPPPEHLCEFRIPFRDPNGQSVGRMSLWYDLTRDGRPLTDLRLIAEQLQPVLWSAIMRLEDDGATETRGEDEAETDHEHVVTVVR